MLVCSKMREFLIMSVLVLRVSSLAPFCLHSLTELGTIRLRSLPRDSKSWELFPETLVTTDDRVSLSFGVACNKESDIQRYKFTNNHLTYEACKASKNVDTIKALQHSNPTQ